MSNATAKGSNAELDPAPDPLDDEPEECALCEGAGFVRKRVRLGHPDFGRAFPCACTRDEQAEDKRARLLRYSNLGPLSRLTFANLITRGRSPNAQHQEQFAAAVRDAMSFAEAPAGWLVFSGPSGCGKTHLAASIAGQCIENGTSALFMVVPDLLDHLRSAYQPGAESGYDELFELVRNAPVLILDDLGVQNATAWVDEKLFQLINHRYASQLPTVITTNLELTAFDQRIQTRLSDVTLSKVHQLEGGSGTSMGDLDSLDLPLLRGMTFKPFDPKFYGRNPGEMRDAQEAYRTAMKYAEDPQQWLILAGHTGRGKTRLAAAIGNYCRENGRDVMLVVVPDLLDGLRAGYNPNNPRDFDAIFDRVRNTQLLILDDLGAQSGTAWADEKLFQLLNHRYNACLATVITTNLTTPEMEPRVVSRITDLEVSTIILMGAFDFWGKVANAPVRTPPRRGRPRANGG